MKLQRNHRPDQGDTYVPHSDLRPGSRRGAHFGIPRAEPASARALSICVKCTSNFAGASQPSPSPRTRPPVPPARQDFALDHYQPGGQSSSGSEFPGEIQVVNPHPPK